MTASPVWALSELGKQELRAVSGKAGIDLRFDLRLNSDEFGSTDGNAEFIWSDRDGAPSIGVPQSGHLGFESVLAQLETGMDGSDEYLKLDIGEATSDGVTEQFLQLGATDVAPNAQVNNVNDDDYNDGLFDYSDLTFEGVDFEIRDMRVKYFSGGNSGGSLGRLRFDGDLGFDGTKLRVWSN